MSVDPHPEVARNASIIVDYVHNTLLESPLARPAQAAIDDIIHLSSKSATPKISFTEPSAKAPTLPVPPTTPTQARQDGYLSASLKRTATVVGSIRNLAFASHS